MLRSTPIRVLSFLVLGVLALTMVVPMVSIIATAFSSKLASLQPGIILWPQPFSLEGFQTLFSRLDFLKPLLNTLMITVTGTALHVLLAALAGFVLAQETLPGRHLIAGLILLTLTIPSQIMMVPLFVLFRQLGLINTWFSLWLSGTVSAFSILLMKTYFEQIPATLVESARLDGAGNLALIRHVYLPLAMPGVLTVAAFQVVYRYNMFTEPLLFITDGDKLTLQIALKSIILSESAVSTNDFIAPNVQMAGILLALLPLLVFYPFMQRYLVRGMLLGAVKG